MRQEKLELREALNQKARRNLEDCPYTELEFEKQLEEQLKVAAALKEQREQLEKLAEERQRRNEELQKKIDALDTVIHAQRKLTSAVCTSAHTESASVSTVQDNNEMDTSPSLRRRTIS